MWALTEAAENYQQTWLKDSFVRFLMEEAAPPLLCSKCEAEFQEGQPTVQHLCGHREHTRCFYRRLINDDVINRSRCGDCEVYLVPNDLLQETETDDEEGALQAASRVEGRERIREKYSTDLSFRKLVKNHVANCRAVRRASADLRKAIQGKKAAVRTEIEGIREQLNTLIEPQVNALKTSPEYKKYISVKSKYSYCSNKLFRAIPGVDEYELMRALQTHRGLRTWRRLSWNCMRSPSSLLRREFYYRIKI